MNVAKKIISKHLVSGKMEAGAEIALKIDQTLTQDATGTMAYLQFEAMGVAKVKTELSVSYVDHNTLQSGFENADDHKFLQTIASKYGIVFSPAGNGICHQVHLERFGVPGKTLIGSDSHTPTGGGIGMLAFGAGGLDVACAMAGQPFYITMPKIIKVNLTGKLRDWVSAKDIILELLRLETVKGGRGKIYEFAGAGVKTLTVPERATITNMGTELGATTSIFPSDEITKDFLARQGRISAWTEIIADDQKDYDGEIVIDLSTLEPLIAQPHMPDKVVKVKDIKGIKVDQVGIGSCTNSSLSDMLLTAEVLKGKKINKNVSFVVSPGSRQVLAMLSQSGALFNIIESGARVLESACGPCIGMGQAPKSGAVSFRTFNRNFEGRSGTKDAKVYLCSPEVALAAALSGEAADPSEYFGAKPKIKTPEKFLVDDAQFQQPEADGSKVEVVKGPNIVSLKQFAFDLTTDVVVALKVGDNISTDHILPAGAKILPYRSNLPKISEFTFGAVDADFAKRASKIPNGVIVGGENYGQGSSREHAALAPRFLNIKIVLTKSFARIHLANLINFGIIPLTFDNPADYDKINQGDNFSFSRAKDILENGEDFNILIAGKGIKIKANYNLTQRQKGILLAGGLLNWIKEKASK
ncbi:aconitate hydratase [Endomicrobium proavitum]|uniref:Aconitate hydratase A n=1 Tax=Endomicrobium proavitum TaxID=1408281 RepID=A0A0G3WLK5_9BACT|nr:aconitate hydratase [Endomicrobium proavitum]AKL98384.1 Aconitate hydratase [Endomicrobium proavitum]